MCSAENEAIDMKRISLIAVLCLAVLSAFSQDIPQSIRTQQIYDYIDELASDHVIHVNSAVQPYSRRFIAAKLREANAKDSLLSKRQQQELRFFMNEYALELDTVPDNWVEWTNRRTFNLSLAQPSFHYITPNKIFKMSIKPILGMEIYANRKGGVMHRWYGAEINMDIAHHVSVWGSLRDNSWNGTLMLSSKYYANDADKIDGAKLTKPQFLNLIPGVQYKEAGYGGDFSDSKGGISVYDWWGSISLQREQIRWGDAYHCSNILSEHAPAVPMLTIRLQPVRWFEFNYFHAWLVSNSIDSTDYYVEHYKEGVLKQHYRPRGKYMAANMFTFSPIKQLSFSFGNSIIYAERNVQAIYFIPIAFFKSLDHLMTKGLGVENQNSQVFFTINTRNLKHVNFYASLFIDEFSISRLKPSNPQHNLLSYLVGAKLSNWPVDGLSATFEFTRSNIACYKHSIDVLAYTSNGYNLGHYMGDNAQTIYAELKYKPVRGLDLKLSYTNQTKYNCYDYVRREISNVISQKPYDEVTYKNDVVAFDAVYQIFSGCYAMLNVQWNNARGNAPTSERIAGEDRGKIGGNYLETPLQGDELAAYYLNRYCPLFWQGKNWSVMAGLTFNF